MLTSSLHFLKHTAALDGASTAARSYSCSASDFRPSFSHTCWQKKKNQLVGLKKKSTQFLRRAQRTDPTQLTNMALVGLISEARLK